MFIKQGLIFKVKKVSWITSHAWVPTIYVLSQDKIIVYFAARNKKNESDIGYFIYDTKREKVIKFSKKPILKRGKTGLFDDSAVIPCQLLKIKNNFCLYYIGWTQGKKIPYMPSLGLAISKSPFGPFKKYSMSPILSKNKNDNYFIASCFVEKIKKNFLMYYTSNLQWKKQGKKMIPRYLIKTGYSKNGYDWITNKKHTIKFKNSKEEAITRPWVIKLNKKFIMFLSLKIKNYKITCATSNNGKNWRRKNINFIQKNSRIKFDSKSQEYASVAKVGSKLYMFYNGNDYGKNGVGLAICKVKDFLKKIK